MLYAAGKSLDLEITVISAKHLHNVNWRNGDLKPYVVLYLDCDRRLTTHSDDSGCTSPVWNERFTLPVTRLIPDTVLNVEVLHYNSSDTVNPIVGSVKFPLIHLLDSANSSSVNSVHSLDLLRPSGRPQGKIRLKLALKEWTPPDFHDTSLERHYHPVATVREYRQSFSLNPHGCSDNLYYSSPAGPSRPTHDRASNYGSFISPSAPVVFSAFDDSRPYAASDCGGPSAPGVDYSPYDHKLSKSFQGMSLGEGNNYEKEKFTERIHSDFAARQGYGYADYHRNLRP